MCGFENCTWFETAAQVRVVSCASKIQIEDSLKDNAKNYQDPGNTVRLRVDAVPLHPGIMTTSKLQWKIIKSASRLSECIGLLISDVRNDMTIFESSKVGTSILQHTSMSTLWCCKVTQGTRGWQVVKEKDPYQHLG